MAQPSLGLIETIGLAAAVDAADAAVKAANVVLVGYELTRGAGMIVVKLQGDVGAVTAAVAAGAASAARVNRVVATKIIARPAAGISQLVANARTVGVEAPAPSRPAGVTPAREEPARQETIAAPVAEVVAEGETRAEAGSVPPAGDDAPARPQNVSRPPGEKFRHRGHRKSKAYDKETAE